MKVLGVMFFFIIFFISCKKEIKKEVEVKNVSYSDCKSNSTKDLLEEQETIRLEAFSPNELKITHGNVIFNCCPDEIKVDVSFNKNILVLNEYSTENLCNCICPYDITYTVSEIIYEEYVFKILKANLEYYEFNIKLSSNLDTTIIIN